MAGLSLMAMSAWWNHGMSPLSNGVLQTIDNLLMPPWVSTVAQSVVANPELSKFVDMLHGNDLLGVLGMEGGYTLFAPINAAFSKTVAMEDYIQSVNVQIWNHKERLDWIGLDRMQKATLPSYSLYQPSFAM
jgi:Fasciclin domain